MRTQRVNGDACFIIFAPVNIILPVFLRIVYPIRRPGICLKQTAYLRLGHPRIIFLPIHFTLTGPILYADKDGEAAEQITTRLQIVPEYFQWFAVTFVQLLGRFSDARER